jgi:hypothetical protein
MTTNQTTNPNLTIGMYGNMAHYFEVDDEFVPAAEPILQMYEEACRKTFRIAKSAVSDNDTRKEAIVWVAVVKTLEALLERYRVEEPEDRVSFGDLNALANAVAKAL